MEKPVFVFQFSRIFFKIIDQRFYGSQFWICLIGRISLIGCVLTKILSLNILYKRKFEGSFIKRSSHMEYTSAKKAFIGPISYRTFPKKNFETFVKKSTNLFLENSYVPSKY